MFSSCEAPGNPLTAINIRMCSASAPGRYRLPETFPVVVLVAELLAETLNGLDVEKLNPYSNIVVIRPSRSSVLDLIAQDHE